jgi:hypothetical protein
MTKKYIFGILCYILAVMLFIAPFLTLFLMKQDKWLVEAEGFEIITGVLIGIGYMFLVFKGALKRVAPLLSLFLTSIMLMLITHFLNSIINDLTLIMASVSLGLLLFIIFYKIGQRQIEIAKIYADEQIKMIARSNPTPRTRRSVNAIKEL